MEVMLKFYRYKEGRGLARTANMVEDLLDKFSEERGGNAVKETLFSRYGDFMDEIRHNDENWCYDASRKMKDIALMHFGVSS